MSWKDDLSGISLDHMVFLDESGVNTDMTRAYGRAKHDKRCVDNTILNTPATTTVLGSIRQSGAIAYTIYQGGTTADRFKEYLENTLLPSLSKDDVIIMDNMKSHHAKAVTSYLDGCGVRYIFLPPYSPDLNPIEKLWSKMKACLKKIKIRKLADIPSGIKTALQTITAANCSGWFHACGYMQ